MSIHNRQNKTSQCGSVPRDPARKVLYLASGRSVLGSNPGRKISSIVRCWRETGATVELVCGGDLPGGVGKVVSEDLKHAAMQERWYQKVGIFAPLVQHF